MRDKATHIHNGPAVVYRRMQKVIPPPSSPSSKQNNITKSSLQNLKTRPGKWTLFLVQLFFFFLHSYFILPAQKYWSFANSELVGALNPVNPKGLYQGWFWQPAYSTDSGDKGATIPHVVHGFFWHVIGWIAFVYDSKNERLDEVGVILSSQNQAYYSG